MHAANFFGAKNNSKYNPNCTKSRNSLQRIFSWFFRIQVVERFRLKGTYIFFVRFQIFANVRHTKNTWSTQNKCNRQSYFTAECQKSISFVLWIAQLFALQPEKDVFHLFQFTQFWVAFFLYLFLMQQCYPTTNWNKSVMKVFNVDKSIWYI